MNLIIKTWFHLRLELWAAAALRRKRLNRLASLSEHKDTGLAYVSDKIIIFLKKH